MMSLELLAEPLPGLKIIRAPRHTDARGFFQETFHEDAYRQLGIEPSFVQDNWSRSTRGTVRGLHYQLRKPQAKLIQVVSGEVFDVAVDIRRGSPSYGKSHMIQLSGAEAVQVYIPEGYAHGFCVVSEQADLMYKCTDFYHADDNYGIHWDDPDLSIEWPPVIDQPTLSDKDLTHPKLRDVDPACLPVFETS